VEPLQLWGGVECTVNRVHDMFKDQLIATGHDRRPGDLRLFADLGMQALRFPILWERHAPDVPGIYDWSWTDSRIQELRELGMRPIAGLVHHGGGPRYTDLLDDGFAAGVAKFAADVAARYPFITDWTPINEPLTTARFAALYGHWYPHRSDEHSFWLALLNEIDATRLAMREVRKIQPAARLVQTDDLGRTYATAAVRDQAAFNNQRRWMAWDLLCGRVVPGHPFWIRLVRMGLQARLEAIAADPCPPDLIGINHYLTSDRFLDHRTARYPTHPSGRNNRISYVDTEAVRALQPPPPGLEIALRDAWDRYGIPLAITEVHNGCTREEQMRWTVEAWETARALRSEGMPIEAVTSWALLGNRGWDRLLVDEGGYEPGAFDLRCGVPRPTALAAVLKSLASGQEPHHPVLAGAGWWRRNIRLHHPVAHRPAQLREHRRSWPRLVRSEQGLLITGASGTLGRALAAECRHRDIAHVLTSRAELDLNDPESITRALERIRPWAVINTAGWVRVDDAEREPDACFAANAEGAERLAAACDALGIPTVDFSSDLVFAGRLGDPYVEGDGPAPLNVYGRSKACAENRISKLAGRHMIIRTAAFFSPYDAHNFAAHLVAALRDGRPFRAARDQVVTPTYVPHLCQAVIDLVIDDVWELRHLSNGTALSWADFGRALADACGLDGDLVEDCDGAELGWRAPRPDAVPLASSKGALLPPLHRAIEHFAAHLAPADSEPGRVAA